MNGERVSPLLTAINADLMRRIRRWESFKVGWRGGQ